MTKVFISYSRKDLAFVDQMTTDLREAGLDVWYDLSGLGGGSRWRLEIEQAIRASQYVVVVLSPDSVASEWVEREYLFSSRLGKSIVPVFLKPCELPLYYLNLHYIDVQGGAYIRNFVVLLRALGVQSTTLTSGQEVPKSAKLAEKQKDTSSSGLEQWLTQRNRKVMTVLMVIALLGFGSAIMAVLNNSQQPTPTPTELRTSTPEPAPTATATKPIWTETPNVGVESAADGAILIHIPAGEFLRGLSGAQVGSILSMCSTCKRDFFLDAMPQEPIYLDEFWIDQNEVTNAQFARFIQETGYVTSAEQQTHDASYVFNLAHHDFIFDAYASWQHPHGTSSEIIGLDTTPVTQVSWEDANAYCNWAGRRLPTEAEWEKAARGEDGRLFVWGNEPPVERFLNYNLNVRGPRPGGSYSAGASPYGLYDIAGNVWEWVSDYYNETYYQNSPNQNPAGPPQGEGHSLRGGSWASEYKDMYLLVAAFRFWNRSYVSSDALGFRCAMDAP